MEGIFSIDTLLKMLILIYFSCIKTQRFKSKKPSRVLLGAFHAIYEYINHTFDAFWSQPTSSHASRFY